MLYKFIQYLTKSSEFTISQLIAIITIAILFAALVWFMPSIIRVMLFPLFIFEFYFLTPGFACGGSLNMFERIEGTHSACTPMAYAMYINYNFGFNNLYVILTYLGLILFMIWGKLNKLKRFIYGDKETLRTQLELQKSAFDASKIMGDIKRTGKI